MERESELIKEYKAGSREALDELFAANNKLIYFVYQRFFSVSGCPKEDMFQEGCLGLMEAIKRFDPEKSHKFYNYKMVWIKKRMYDFRRNFFKLRTVELNDSHLAIQYSPPSSEKFRFALFELDNLVKAGKMPANKAKKILAKIQKGTK